MHLVSSKVDDDLEPHLGEFGGILLQFSDSLGEEIVGINFHTSELLEPGLVEFKQLCQAVDTRANLNEILTHVLGDGKTRPQVRGMLLSTKLCHGFAE